MKSTSLPIRCDFANSILDMCCALVYCFAFFGKAAEAAREWMDAFTAVTYSSHLEISCAGRKEHYLAVVMPAHARRFEALL